MWMKKLSAMLLREKIVNNSYINLFVYTVLLLSIIITTLGCGRQFRTPIFEAGKKDNFGPTGLTHNGKEFIMVGKGNFIYTVFDVKLDPYQGIGFGAAWGDYKTSGDPINPERRDIEICGLAWEGGCCGKNLLWAVDSTNLEIIKMDEQGNIIKVLPSPCDNPSGVAFDGNSLWISDEVAGKIYNISRDDGTILKSFSSPISHPSGLTWGKNLLWVVGSREYKTQPGSYRVGLFGIDVNNGTSYGTYRLRHIERPSSVTWADGVLWVADFNKNRIFTVRPIYKFFTQLF